jgi:type IV pilus assembly protein PilA
MYFALMGKLSARRQNLAQDKDKGFTLIELLVVVIIIGILAAIAIPVYLGVQNNAKDSSVKSDLTNAKTAVIAYQTSTGALPTAGALDPAATTGQNAELAKAGLTKSGNTGAITLVVSSDKTAFCVSAPRVGGDSFAASDRSGVDKGSCSAAGVFTAPAAGATTP